MSKSFKRFISTMLVACMAMSMVAGAAGTEEASEAEVTRSANAGKTVDCYVSIIQPDGTTENTMVEVPIDANATQAEASATISAYANITRAKTRGISDKVTYTELSAPTRLTIAQYVAGTNGTKIADFVLDKGSEAPFGYAGLEVRLENVIFMNGRLNVSVCDKSIAQTDPNSKVYVTNIDVDDNTSVNPKAVVIFWNATTTPDGPGYFYMYKNHNLNVYASSTSGTVNALASVYGFDNRKPTTK